MKREMMEMLVNAGVKVVDGMIPAREAGFATAVCTVLARSPTSQKRDGMQFGDPRGPDPESADNNKLSRILDMLDSAKKAGVNAKAVWEAIPPKWQTEFNYANWKYEV